MPRQHRTAAIAMLLLAMVWTGEPAAATWKERVERTQPEITLVQKRNGYSPPPPIYRPPPPVYRPPPPVYRPPPPVYRLPPRTQYLPSPTLPQMRPPVRYSFQNQARQPYRSLAPAFNQQRQQTPMRLNGPNRPPPPALPPPLAGASGSRLYRFNAAAASPSTLRATTAFGQAAGRGGPPRPLAGPLRPTFNRSAIAGIATRSFNAATARPLVAAPLISASEAYGQVKMPPRLASAVLVRRPTVLPFDQQKPPPPIIKPTMASIRDVDVNHRGWLTHHFDCANSPWLSRCRAARNTPERDYTPKLQIAPAAQAPGP